MKQNKTILLSEQIKELRPDIISFIIGLKYSRKKAELFADGYFNELKRLPTIEKLKAISNQHDGCMAAGFLNAGINEDEALTRSKQI